MLRQVIEIEGKRFVVIEESELHRLERRPPAPRRKGGVPPALPKPDRDGNVPALELIRVSIARDIIRERKAMGLTQERLAQLAGIRQESLSRIESGKHSPTVRTVEKIDGALKRASAESGRPSERKAAAKKVRIENHLYRRPSSGAKIKSK